MAEPDSSSSSESDSDYKPSSATNSRDSEDDETIYTECDENESGSGKDGFDAAEFRKTIAKMFPSKYARDRARVKEKERGKRNSSKDVSKSSSSSKHRHKHRKEVDSSEEDSSDSEGEAAGSSSEEDCKREVRKSKRRKSKEDKRAKRKKTTRKKTTDSSEEDISDEDEDEDALHETGKISVILSMGGMDDEFADFDEDSEIESLIEDATEDFDSDAEKTFMGDEYEQFAESSSASPKKRDSDKKSKKRSKSKNAEEDQEKPKKHPAMEDDKDPIPEDVKTKYKEMLDLKKMLVELLKRTPKNKIVRNSLEECNLAIKKLTRKARHANTNAYYKLVNSEKRQTNELDYFKHRLSNKEQQEIMTDLKEINRSIYADKPYRLALLQSKIPAKFKMVAMQRLNMLKSMEPGDHEYYKVKHWVDAFMRIPFGVYRNIHIRKSDGIDACDQFMEGARKTLNDCVYGLNDAKMQIMQMLGQWIVNPDSVGTAIAIHGPPGTGKTSIVKDGISKILGREFAFIALGGCGDGSFLEGHSYTYEGSSWGKIAQILMECKSMNPIIYFDELDKVSDSARGQEIIGILTHLTDTTQNSEFHDKYFSDVSLDLSKCLFIFSYNDEALVNPILKDRMYRIQTKGYDSKEKITIARDYLLPKIREQVSFGADEIIIPDDTLQYLISTPHLTKSESGVRNLKRCLEIIYTKLNLYRLVKPGNPMFEKDLGVKVAFPITITRKEVDMFIKNNETLNQSFLAMYV